MRARAPVHELVYILHIFTHHTYQTHIFSYGFSFDTTWLTADGVWAPMWNTFVAILSLQIKTVINIFWIIRRFKVLRLVHRDEWIFDKFIWVV